MHQGSQRFVLTGGIGSGKSYVAARLESRGWAVIDADRIGHEVIQPGGAAFEAVAGRWPDVVVDGAIDRRALGRIVFASEGDLAELESYTHPAIRATIAERIVSAGARVVLEIPLLNEWLPTWPRVVVEAPLDVRVARLEQRGMSGEEIADRLAAQPDEHEWHAAADFLIDNGGEADLDRELDRLERFMLNRVG